MEGGIPGQVGKIAVSVVAAVDLKRVMAGR